MSRWKASFIHLLVSILVVGTVAAFIVYFWYPPALMHMAKADKLLLMIGSIDLVVGPLLTLIIYKANKRYLKLDLFIIGLIQVLFLGYGLHTTFSSRPVFLVAVPDRFELVFANEIRPERLSEATLHRYRKLGLTRPQLVGAKLPEDEKEKENIMLSALNLQGDIQHMPKYYTEYPEIVTSLLKNAHPLLGNKALKPSDAEALLDAAKDYGYEAEHLRYVALASSRGFAVILIKAETGEVVGPVNVDP